MKIGFYGAARTVTGSKHLISLDNGTNILLDCGLFQGRFNEAEHLNRNFDFDPKSIQYLILSHAHIDHSGNIPYLVKRGFRGKIYCTPATFDLCEIMLADSAHIQEADVQFINKIKSKKGKPPIEPLYTLEDVKQALSLFHTLPYNRSLKICHGVELTFVDTGHILGSAAIHLKINETGTRKKLLFTGDIGRYNTRILVDPQPFPESDIIICESTYGNRFHPEVENAEQELLNEVLETCRQKKGKLIIPAFSLGRTQEIVFALDKFNLYGLIPEFRVYVDSPLSLNATNIFKKHPECFNFSFTEFIEKDSDPFGFDKLTYIRNVNDSMALNSKKEPCIIISASGMAEAGRIKHHLKNNLEDKKNTILIVGYAEPSTLAGKLKQGDKNVIIFGESYNVNADVHTIDAFSAHADQNELIKYLSCQKKENVHTLFLVHGNYESQQHFRDKLMATGYRNVIMPEFRSVFTIN